MNPDHWDHSQKGEPSTTSSVQPVPSAPTSTSITLPPISSIYDFSAGDTASAPDPDPDPDATITNQAYHHHRPLSPSSGQAASSFTTWTTSAINNQNNNTTERNADDDDDDDDDDDEAGDYDFEDTNFVYEHGRRYHANAHGRVMYPLPNDESEQERDDMKHKLALWMMHEKLFYAPVEEVLTLGGMVMDLGTGTGEWAMEMAQKFGKSQFYGCDISPIQPDYVWDNVFFSAADFEEEWTDYPENAFDYIHMRYAAFAIKDPAALIQRAMRHLKPGGYLEFQEMTYWPCCDDATLTPSTPYAFRDFCHYQQAALARLGLDLHTAARLPALLRDAGLADVAERRHKLPIGRWPRDRRQREKGIWFLRMVLLEGLGGICKRAFCQGLGWTDVQVEMFLVDVRRSLNDAGVHAYLPFTVVWGRKPLGQGQHGEGEIGGGEVGGGEEGRS